MGQGGEGEGQVGQGGEGEGQGETGMRAYPYIQHTSRCKLVCLFHSYSTLCNHTQTHARKQGTSGAGAWNVLEADTHMGRTTVREMQ